MGKFQLPELPREQESTVISCINDPKTPYIAKAVMVTIAKNGGHYDDLDDLMDEMDAMIESGEADFLINSYQRQ